MRLPPPTSFSPGPAPHIVAVGFRRINKMLQELAPEFASQATVEVLDMGFEEAVARVRELQARRTVDVVVAAGSNGGYLRQHLETPVVLVKVGGFDLVQALARAKRMASQVGLVSYEGSAPDLAPFTELLDLGVEHRSYRTEDDARACLREMAQRGVQVVVGPGLVADLADQIGLTGVFLYSMDAVREALRDAVEVARAARIEMAKRERLNTILAQLGEGVIAVDREERIQTLNPAMARLLDATASQWVGRRLSEACPELSLRDTLEHAVPDIERIEKVKGRALIVNRLPIIEQGLLTGAVVHCQDPASIQRVDRHIRTRMKPGAMAVARHEIGAFLGDSAPAVRLRQLALTCARSEATVLLIGESGTGKELIAQGIHAAGPRRDMPFVAVNCAAVAESLLESELFGYEEGAFTGARRGGKMGLFEAAHNGTLFLDEVGEMPPSLQARLLRVLQERQVLRVGATEPTPVNVRVIAATHRDLSELVARGAFRLDLFYRLNILRLDVPPLRDRREDIGPIAQALHRQACARLGRDRSRTAPWVEALVRRAAGHGWPGNVRELENLIERLVAYADLPSARGAESAPVDEAFLEAVAPEIFIARERGAAATGCPRVDTIAPTGRPPAAAGSTPRHRAAPVDAGTVLRLLSECGGDRAAVCRALGISRTTLWRKLRERSEAELR